MKKLILSLFITAGLLSACSEEEPQIAKVDPVIVELGNFNQKLVDQTFKKFNQVITADTIKYALKMSDSRATFIAMMRRYHKDFFIDAAETEPRAADYFLKIGDIKGESLETQEAEVFKLLASPDPLNQYIKNLQEETDATDHDHKDWIIILSKDEANGPVNADQIHAMLKFGKMIFDSSIPESEMNEAMKDLQSNDNIPAIMIGLLLPAVQKINPDSNPNSQMLEWLDETVNPAVQGALDRDIIRRVAAMSYIGSLDRFLSQDYSKDDKYSAAIELSYAGHEVMLMYLWDYVWRSQPK